MYLNFKAAACAAIFPLALVACGGGGGDAPTTPAAATGCASLQSGRYRWINPNESSTSPDRSFVVSANVSTGVVTYPNGSTATASMDGSCTFSLNAGAMRMFVSPSGAWVSHYVDQSVVGLNGVPLKRIAFGLPEQALTLADLAGNWNGMGFFRSGLTDNPLQMLHTRMSLGSDGAMSAIECGNGPVACGALQANGQLSVNSAGGFNFTAAPGVLGVPDRVFAYRAPNGSMMAVALFADQPNALLVATKDATLSLPAVGDVQTFWDMTINPFAFANPYTDELRNITGIDTAAGSYTRLRPLDGRVDGFTVNSPRNGLRHRAPATVTLSDGTPFNVSEIIALPLGGMGITVYGRVTTTVTNGFYGVSVTKP
jgi:hypothetical protein